MICGLGIDAASIERTGRLDEHAVSRIFHPEEVEQYKQLGSAVKSVRDQFLASRFAVKEAYAKARGLGFASTIVPCEICTCKDENGKPYVKLEGKTLENHPKDQVIHVSITHQEPLAIAIVILEKEDSHVQG